MFSGPKSIRVATLIKNGSKLIRVATLIEKGIKIDSGSDPNGKEPKID